MLTSTCKSRETVYRISKFHLRPAGYVCVCIYLSNDASSNDNICAVIIKSRLLFPRRHTPDAISIIAIW